MLRQSSWIAGAESVVYVYVGVNLGRVSELSPVYGVYMTCCYGNTLSWRKTAIESATEKP
jgi:hypothetical protein